jgi:hypothetical protein
MLSTNVNQYLAFQPQQRTRWVYEWGAQVRKYKISKSPHLKKPLSSIKTYTCPIIYNEAQKDIRTLYSTILQYSKDPQDHKDYTTKTLLDQ